MVLLHIVARAATTTVDGTRVYVNELLVATFPTSAEANRFASAIQKTPNGSPVRVTNKKRSAKLFAAGKEVLLITRTMASRNGSTPVALASDWSSRLRKALALPPIKIDQTTVILGGGGVSRLGMVGSAAKSASVEFSDPQIASATYAKGVLTIRAKSLGSTALIVSGGSNVTSISVRVLPAGAAFPQSLTSVVTGLPATGDIVKGAVISALNNQLKMLPEAEVKYVLPTTTSLASNGVVTYPVRVKVSGRDCLPAEGIVNVTVRNAPVGFAKEGELWYCNDPETVRAPGLLFTAQLSNTSPARLLYHHLNASPGGLFIDIQAINESDQPAQIVITPGEGQPDPNPVRAGIDAAENFYRNYVYGAGELITIPPRSTFPIALRRLAPHQTLSGLCYLRLLAGGPSQLTVVAAAKATFGLDSKWTAAMASSTPWRFIGSQRITGLTPRVSIYSDHVYPNPFKTEEVTYMVGGRHPFIRIGENAIPRFDKQSALSGNFGVTYTIKAEIQNPMDVPVDLEMVFEASAGYSGALFIFNGEVRRTPLIQPKREVVFGKLRLEGGMTKNLTILTIPLSGSSYPATITVRPAESSMKAVAAYRG